MLKYQRRYIFQPMRCLNFFLKSSKSSVTVSYRNRTKKKKNSTEFSQYANTHARGKFYFIKMMMIHSRNEKKTMPNDRSTNRPIDWPTNIRKKNKIIIIWYDSSKIYGHFKNNFWKLLEKKEKKHSKRITRKMLENIGISTILMLHLKEKIWWLVGWLASEKLKIFEKKISKFFPLNSLSSQFFLLVFLESIPVWIVFCL